MKKLPILLFFCLALFTIANAQTPPNAFNYSAVARNAAGQPIVTSTIGIQISILKTSTTGTSQYSENHFVNTDAFGLFNLVIGAGAMQSGSMATIDWSNDNYYLKVGMDVAGGTNFLTMGTTQLLSVPYALYAKSAGSVSVGSSGNFNHFIGEEFGGGVIFHVWKDAQGLEHGLIVDKVDLSTSQVWSNVDSTLIGPSAQSAWDGLSNSNAIVTQPGHSNSAAALCLNSTNGGQSDWYLPSIQELNLLWNNYQTIARSFLQLSSATQLSPEDYWSSSEADNDYTVYFAFSYGSSEGDSKISVKYVRAVRSF
jgi:hypothetical protein